MKWHDIDIFCLWFYVLAFHDYSRRAIDRSDSSI